jgi:hypothetical protein
VWIFFGPTHCYFRHEKKNHLQFTPEEDTSVNDTQDPIIKDHLYNYHCAKLKGHRQRIFLLAIFVHVGYLNKDMYFIWNENDSIRSKKQMKLV